jgi:uncharacterized protein YjbJ (UPF0337 family)
VSIAKTIAHKAETIKGSIKKMTRRATGSHRLRTEGRGDQGKGYTKQAGASVRAASRH